MDVKAKASALYCCPSCSYQTLISATSEFIRFYSVEFCPDCNILDKKKYYIDLVLMENGVGRKGFVWAHLSQEESHCEHCNPGAYLHWTELKVPCPDCKSADMIFKEDLRTNHKKPVSNFGPSVKGPGRKIKR